MAVQEAHIALERAGVDARACEHVLEDNKAALAQACHIADFDAPCRGLGTNACRLRGARRLQVHTCQYDATEVASVGCLLAGVLRQLHCTLRYDDIHLRPCKRSSLSALGSSTGRSLRPFLYSALEHV